jgi:hypothetical protein
LFCIIYLIYPNSIANLCVIFLLKEYKLFIFTEAWVVGCMDSRRQNKIFMFKLTVESLPRTLALPPLSLLPLVLPPLSFLDHAVL